MDVFGHRGLILAALGVVAAILLLSLPLAGDDDLASVLVDRGIAVEGGTDLGAVDQSTSTIAGLAVWTVRLEGETGVTGTIRLFEDIGSGFADRYVTDRLDAVRALFVQKPAPYEAVPVPEADCSDGFSPKIERSQEVHGNRTMALLYAGEDEVYTCDEAEASQRAVRVLLYCPRQRVLLDLELLAPMDGPANLTASASSFVCQGS